MFHLTIFPASIDGLGKDVRGVERRRRCGTRGVVAAATGGA
jgi:hypothetical protein